MPPSSRARRNAELLLVSYRIGNTGTHASVLIVDDDRLFLRALGRELSQQHSVHLASCAVDALRVLEQYRIVAVITDYDLGPPPTGLELLTRAQLKYPTIRRILISGQQLGHLAQQSSTSADTGSNESTQRSGVVERFVHKSGGRSCGIRLLEQLAHWQGI